MQLKSGSFLMKNNNYLLENVYLILNTQVWMQTYFIKLFTMYKFVHNRKHS